MSAGLRETPLISDLFQSSFAAAMGKNVRICPHCDAKFDRNNRLEKHLSFGKCKVLNEAAKVKTEKRLLPEKQNEDEIEVMTITDDESEDQKGHGSFPKDESNQSVDIDMNEPEEETSRNVEESDVDETDNAETEKCCDDEEVVVVKANIFKYGGGEMSNDKAVKQNVMNIKYFDDFDENDVVILDDSNSDAEEDDLEEEPEEAAEEAPELTGCRLCSALLEERDMAGHLELSHPIPPTTTIKQFQGGFFMIAGN